MKSVEYSNQNGTLDIDGGRLLPLTEKYRPKSFDELIGNSFVVGRFRSLTAELKGSTRNFLLFGPSGVGKTSIGEILIAEFESGEIGFRGVYRYMEQPKVQAQPLCFCL
jgi:replication-associated recombination protein RarA